MQKIQEQEIERRLNQLCENLNSENREHMTYTQAVFITSDFYKTYGRNLTDRVLEAIKKSVSQNSNGRIYKYQLKNIFRNEELGLLGQLSKSTSISQLERKSIGREEYKYAESAIQFDYQSKDHTINMNESKDMGIRSHPKFPGSRRTITFCSNMNVVDNPIKSDSEIKTTTINEDKERIPHTNYTSRNSYDHNTNNQHYHTNDQYIPKMNGNEYSSKLHNFTIRYDDNTYYNNDTKYSSNYRSFN